MTESATVHIHNRAEFKSLFDEYANETRSRGTGQVPGRARSCPSRTPCQAASSRGRPFDNIRIDVGIVATVTPRRPFCQLGRRAFRPHGDQDALRAAVLGRPGPARARPQHVGHGCAVATGLPHRRLGSHHADDGAARLSGPGSCAGCDRRGPANHVTDTRTSSP